MECGAILFLAPLVVRAAPFALLIAKSNIGFRAELAVVPEFDLIA